MADYKKYINALRKCAKEHENDRTFTGHIIVSDLCRDTANLLETLEQEPKTGHWIAQNIHNCHTDFKCSECGYIHNFTHLYGEPTADYTYCPNCGTRMIKSKEGSDKE